MTITIERESDIPLPFSEQEIAEAVILETLDYEDCPYEVQVNIILTSDEEIHQINLEQRGVDAPTDVLSFPMIEFAYPSDFTVLEGDQMVLEVASTNERAIRLYRKLGLIPTGEKTRWYRVL